MTTTKPTAEEIATAISRMNQRQNRRGVYTNIGKREIAREVRRMRKAS